VQDVPQDKCVLAGGTHSVPVTGTAEWFHLGGSTLSLCLFSYTLKFEALQEVAFLVIRQSYITPNITELHDGLICILFPKVRINLDVSIVFPEQC